MLQKAIREQEKVSGDWRGREDCQMGTPIQPVSHPLELLDKLNTSHWIRF